MAGGFRERVAFFSMVLAVVVFSSIASAGGYVGYCGISGGAEDENVPHHGCGWGGSYVEDTIIQLVAMGSDCYSEESSYCTMNVDMYDARTGEFMENTNIIVPKVDGALQNCDDVAPGDVICGPPRADITGDDCGDGSGPDMGGKIDESCGCNSEENDEACCFKEDGKSVDLVSGYYTRHEDDVLIRGAGIDFRFTRYYNSKRGDVDFRGEILDRGWREYMPNVIGHGWRHRYQERIRILFPRDFEAIPVEQIECFKKIKVGQPKGNEQAEGGIIRIFTCNKNELIYYRPDGVGIRMGVRIIEYSGHEVYSFKEFISTASLNRTSIENGSVVITKPSGERHIFYLPDDLRRWQKPIEIPIGRIESCRSSESTSCPGIDFYYDGEPGTDCPEGFLCRAVIDDGGGRRGARFHYNDRGLLEQISTLDGKCLALYNYDEFGNLHHVSYNSGDSDECDTSNPIEYVYDVWTEESNPPEGAFTCARLENGECEWICGEDARTGRCLPLWPACGIPDDQGNCPQGCEAVTQFEGGRCVKNNGSECDPPSYGFCPPGCHLEGASEKTVCVPSAGNCPDPGTMELVGGYWGERMRCVYDEMKRSRAYDRLSEVYNEDGIREEKIRYQPNGGEKVESVTNTTEKTEYSYGWENPLYHGDAPVRPGGWTQIRKTGNDPFETSSDKSTVYYVGFDEENRPVVIDGDCPCGPVREIEWQKTATGIDIDKTMKYGRSSIGGGGSTSTSVESITPLLTSSKSIDSGNETSITIFYLGWNFSQPEKIVIRTRSDNSFCSNLSFHCDNTEIYIDYDDPYNDVDPQKANSNPTDRPYAIKVKGCAYDMDESGEVTCGLREVVTSLSYDDHGRIQTIDGPLADDTIVFEYHGDGAGLDAGRLYKVSIPVNIAGSGTYRLETRYKDYNVMGLPETIIDFNGNAWKMRYDLRGRIVEFSRPSGATYRLAYRGERLASITLPKGNVIEFAPVELLQPHWGFPSGFIESLSRKDAAGAQALETAEFYLTYLQRLERVQYLDASGNVAFLYRSLVGETGMVERIWNTGYGTEDAYKQFGYDGLNNLSEYRDERRPEDPTMIFNYDEYYRLSSIYSPETDIRNFTYGPMGDLTSVSVRGGVATYERDGFGRITRIDTPDSGTTWFIYDNAGNLVKRKTERDDTPWNYHYDASGRLWRVEKQGAPPVYFCFDGNTNQYCPPAAEGARNLLGRLSAVVDENQRVFFSYTDDGFLEFEYHEPLEGDLEQPPAPYRISYTYDANGNASSITYPSGRTVLFLRPPEAAGRGFDRVAEVQVVEPDGSARLLATDIRYKPFGPVKSYVLGNGLEVRVDYNQGYGIEFVKTIRPDGLPLGVLQMSHDERGDIFARGLNYPGVQGQEDFTYDGIRRLVSAEGPWGMENYGLDWYGNRLWMDWEDAEGHAKGFDYVYEPGDCLDPWATGKTSDRITCIIDPVFTDEPVECEDEDPHQHQHGEGHRKRIGRGHHTCWPDAPPGQLKKDRDGDGIPDDADLGHLNADLAGLIEDITRLVQSIPTGEPWGVHRGWREHFQRRYNSIKGQLIAIMNRHGLHLRALKRIFFRDENFYRLLGELLRSMFENGPRWTEEQRELALGALDAARRIDAEAAVRDMAERGLLMTPVRYDEAGNMVQKGELCYRYDERGRLWMVGLIQESSLPLVKRKCDWERVVPLAEFRYDAWGRRIRKKVYGVSTWFAWDGEGHVISEAMPDGTFWKDYIYLEGRPLAMRQSELGWAGCGCSAGGRGATGGLLVFIVPFGLLGVFRRRRKLSLVVASAGLVVVVFVLVTCEGDCGYRPESRYYFFHTDHRGAPVFMTDENAEAVWTALYRPYGEAYIDPDPDGDNITISNPLRYPGQYEDTLEDFPEGERLYYNVMRYYDPGLGRYLSLEIAALFRHDPEFLETPSHSTEIFYELPIFLNSYLYGFSTPLMIADPLGAQNSTYDRLFYTPYFMKCAKEGRTKECTKDYIDSNMAGAAMLLGAAASTFIAREFYYIIVTAAGYSYDKFTDVCNRFYLKFSQLLERALGKVSSEYFRIDKNEWGNGPPRWHFHFDPFPGNDTLMKHHLPYEIRTWYRHFLGKLRGR